jgi:rRNA maturation endonuclease Nob1
LETPWGYPGDRVSLITLQVESVILLVVMLILIIYMIYDMYSRRPRRKTYHVKETLICTKCKYVVEREFEPGDFIGLIKGKCPTCGGDLKVKAIYAIEKEQK